MAAFATVEDLEVIFAGTVDETRGELALTLASGMIRGWTRQTLDYVEADTLVVAGTWATHLVLPQRPVVSVTSVTVDDVLLAAADWELAGDTLIRTGGAGWGGPAVTVTVVYDHGYDAVPDDIRAFCLRIATRYLNNPQGLRTEQIGTYSVGFGGAITGAAVADPEWQELGRYRTRAAAVPI